MLATTKFSSNPTRISIRLIEQTTSWLGFKAVDELLTGERLHLCFKFIGGGRVCLGYTTYRQ